MKAGAVGWDDIASWYDERLASGTGPHETALACTLRLCAPVKDLDVLDLACGQGFATRALAREGCRTITGIDSSTKLLERARAYETAKPLQIMYVRDDAEHLESVPSESVDLVNCQLALMDIPDLDATLAAVRRVLRPGGTFVFVIGHPAFLAPFASTVVDSTGRPGRLITEYLEDRFWRSDNPEGIRRVGNYHRKISTYMNAVQQHGLQIDAVDEPAASPRLLMEQAVYGSVPIVLGVRTTRR